MLMMRLQRIGRRNEAHFKIVVIEKTQGPKSQKYVDILGSYNPKQGSVILDEEKAKIHLSNGVQPSDTVYNMLVDKGLVEGRKKNVLPHKSPVVDEEKLAREKEEAEAKAQAEKEAAEAAAQEEESADDASEEASSEETPLTEEPVVETPEPEAVEEAAEETPEGAENNKTDES
tara:strand:- start:348 stop:869 length:522 start_codon:yes stop_codon:yes gene_type:complete